MLRARLARLYDTLLLLAEERNWRLQAWAVFPNHYHFIVDRMEAGGMPAFIRTLHSTTAAELNQLDQTSGRKVWFQYWETHLTYSRSYFARLSYVHQNAVHHGLVSVPSAYLWCSAGWFERRAERSLHRRIMEFSPTRLKVPDDFIVEKTDLGEDF